MSAEPEPLMLRPALARVSDIFLYACLCCLLVSSGLLIADFTTFFSGLAIGTAIVPADEWTPSYPITIMVGKHGFTVDDGSITTVNFTAFNSYLARRYNFTQRALWGKANVVAFCQVNFAFNVGALVSNAGAALIIGIAARIAKLQDHESELVDHPAHAKVNLRRMGIVQVVMSCVCSTVALLVFSLGFWPNVLSPTWKPGWGSYLEMACPPVQLLAIFFAALHKERDDRPRLLTLEEVDDRRSSTIAVSEEGEANSEDAPL